MCLCASARVKFSHFFARQKVASTREYLLFHANRDDNYPYSLSFSAVRAFEAMAPMFPARAHHCRSTMWACECLSVHQPNAKHMRKHVLINWVVFAWPWPWMLLDSLLRAFRFRTGAPSNWIESTIDFHFMPSGQLRGTRKFYCALPFAPPKNVLESAFGQLGRPRRATHTYTIQWESVIRNWSNGDVLSCDSNRVRITRTAWKRLKWRSDWNHFIGILLSTGKCRGDLSLE